MNNETIKEAVKKSFISFLQKQGYVVEKQKECEQCAPRIENLKRSLADAEKNCENEPKPNFYTETQHVNVKIDGRIYVIPKELLNFYYKMHENLEETEIKATEMHILEAIYLDTLTRTFTPTQIIADLKTK